MWPTAGWLTEGQGGKQGRTEERVKQGCGLGWNLISAWSQEELWKINWTTALVSSWATGRLLLFLNSLPWTHTLTSQSLATDWPVGGILPMEHLPCSPGQSFREQDSWEPLVAQPHCSWSMRAPAVKGVWQGYDSVHCTHETMVYGLWPYWVV